MIKKLKTAAVAAAFLLIQGCTLLFDLEPSVFQVTGAVNCTAPDTRITLTVECDVFWTVEMESDWARIYSPEDHYLWGDGYIEIFFDPNTSPDPRTAVVVIQSGSKTERRTITQGGANSLFYPSELVLTGTETATLSFTAPEAWSAVVKEGADWIKLSGHSSGAAGKVTLTVYAADENKNVGSRRGSLSITIGEAVYSVSVTQGQKDVLIVSDTEISLDYKACEFSLRTSYNVNYDIQSSVSWIRHLAQTKALNESGEVFSVEENTSEDPRTGTIRFSASGVPELTVTVVQKGKDMVMIQDVPGAYRVDGKTFCLGDGGWNLSSRVFAADGSFEYRMLNAASLSVLRITGIDPQAAAGSSCKVHIVQQKMKDIVFVQDYPATVAAIDEEFIRLRGENKTYFIIQRPQ